MKNRTYPLVVAIVKPSEFNGRVIRGTALRFCKARETAKFYFIEYTPTHERKYPKIEPNEYGRLSECERGTEKLTVGFSKSYVYDPNCEFVQEIKTKLLDKGIKDFKGEPIV